MTPCGISWCVALTDKQFCPAHFKDRNLKPKVYKREPIVKHWPRTPWDDERPWWEDKR